LASTSFAKAPLSSSGDTQAQASMCPLGTDPSFREGDGHSSPTSSMLTHYSGHNPSSILEGETEAQNMDSLVQGHPAGDAPNGER
jgi:hypothetical protein